MYYTYLREKKGYKRLYKKPTQPEHCRLLGNSLNGLTRNIDYM